MIYAQIISGVVMAYPYTLDELYAANPNTSFPENPTLDFLATYDVYEVVPVAPPSYNPATQVLEELVPTWNGSIWQQTWAVITASPAQQLAYKEQFIDDAKANTMQYLDTFASTRDYQNSDRCCGYKGSSNSQLDADATYMRSARDSVITSAYSTLAQIKSGAIPVPTMSAFMATLPALSWPNPETMPAVDGTAVL